MDKTVVFFCVVFTMLKTTERLVPLTQNHDKAMYHSTNGRDYTAMVYHWLEPDKLRLS